MRSAAWARSAPAEPRVLVWAAGAIRRSRIATPTPPASEPRLQRATRRVRSPNPPGAAEFGHAVSGLALELVDRPRRRWT